MQGALDEAICRGVCAWSQACHQAKIMFDTSKLDGGAFASSYYKNITVSVFWASDLSM